MEGGGGKINLQAETLQKFKQQIKDELLSENIGGELYPLNLKLFGEIMQEFTEVKLQIRQAASKDEKICGNILTKIASLEKTMDGEFQDLVEQVNGIGKRLEELNAEFFTKIF